MHAWESIQKTLEIIENRIGDDIQIEELADAAALSQFYYQRLFVRLVKKPVREYIKLRRLARACEALRNSNNKILDVAVEYGFGSHEAFSRAFKDAYSMTPTQYRQSDVWLNNFDKPDLLLNYTMIDIGVPLISDGLVLEMSRRTLERPVVFMGLQGYVSIGGKFPVGETTGVDEPGVIWQRFHQVKQHIPRVPNGREIGASHMGDAPSGCFCYFAGAEIDSKDSAAIAENFRIWTLPANDYLICGFEAENFEELVTVALNKAIKYMGLWQSKHNLKHEDFGAEIYFNVPDEADAAYMEMWALWAQEGK